MLAASTAALAVPALLILGSGSSVADPDIWWHLRTGQWMFQHHRWPHTDPFSYWAAGHPWAAYSWTFELLVLALFRAWGLFGIVAYSTAMVALIAWSLLRLLSRYLPRIISASLCGLGVYLLYPLIWPRPGMWTIVFFILQLQFLLPALLEHDTRGAWWLPLLYLLWANVHIQFIYGLFLLASAAAEPLIRKCLGSSVAPVDWAVSRALWKILGLSLSATLINPYFFGLYGVVWQYMQQTRAFDYIIELQALDFRRVKDYVELLLALATAFSLGWKREFRPFFVIIVLAATLAAFRAERDAWFLVTVDLAVIACLFRTQTAPLPIQHKLLIAVATCFLILAGGAFTAGARPASLRANLENSFPVKACDFLDARGYTGPLFNVIDWGGYVIWRLPQMPVAIDGRTNLYGDDYLSLQEDTWDGKPVWARNQELAHARVILAPRALPLTSILLKLTRYEVIYDDGFAVVLTAK